MAQPQQQQQFRPPPYASPHSTPSPMPQGPNPAFKAPPINRPQLSPQSPAPNYQSLQSPPIQNGSMPYQANPYHTSNANPYPLPGQQPLSPRVMSPLQQGAQVRNTPPPSQMASQQPQQQGTMAPPAKPDDDKQVDLNDIGDVMTGVGIDLKAEEAALTYGNNARKTQYGGGQAPSAWDPQRNVYQSSKPGGRDSFYGAGTFNQPATAASPQSMEDELLAREKVAKRKMMERKQYHGNEPFLLNNVILSKIHNATQKTQTVAQMEGVFQPQRPVTTKLVIAGPEGQERIATLTKEPLLSMTAPMVDILALLSTACRERVRTVLEDSATLARGRRMTSHGIVPPDFADIAKGEGKPTEAVAEPVPLIGAVSPGASSRKRSHSVANDRSTPGSQAFRQDRPKPVPTIAYPDLIAAALQKQYEAEEVFERERLAKRAKRHTTQLITGSNPSSHSNSIAGTPGPATPGAMAPAADSIAPSGLAEGKMTKKEQKRMQEQQAATSAVKDTKNAVQMALGGGKKYSWMSGGKAGSGGLGTGTSFARRTPAAAPTAKKAIESVADNATGPAVAAQAAKGARVRGGREFGAWREDREDGKGIQVRDVVAVLKDGKEKRTLSKAFSRLK